MQNVHFWPLNRGFTNFPRSESLGTTTVGFSAKNWAGLCCLLLVLEKILLCNHLKVFNSAHKGRTGAAYTCTRRARLDERADICFSLRSHLLHKIRVMLWRAITYALTCDNSSPKGRNCKCRTSTRSSRWVERIHMWFFTYGHVVLKTRVGILPLGMVLGAKTLTPFRIPGQSWETSPTKVAQKWRTYRSVDLVETNASM